MGVGVETVLRGKKQSLFYGIYCIARVLMGQQASTILRRECLM